MISKVIRILAGMFGQISNWLKRRRALRSRRNEDARLLLARNPHTAYYDAQRLAARARFSGDGKSFLHWASVAAEVAKISDNPMDMKVVQAIVTEEERRATHGSTPARPT
ncbi:hypothetical protein [Pseudorhodoplanes sp.]|jgi:hypothetical protein|uniref:hypothetical protein n=1 Tax=Pseudorhodoplanes sp. TaxID=1934341 RepID=UPI002CD54CCD|nr:hypothetical protein [Pseudorhodoplanes sp.]HWV42823.1 hypothetical protein [Pseudorhodoplanes sp.]